MFLLLSLLVAIGAATAPLFKRDPNIRFAASQANPNNWHDGKGLGRDVYIFHTGDGSTARGWPAMSDWVSWEEMFNANKPIIRKGCSNNGWPILDNTEDETGKIWDAVNVAAQQTGVDHRFIFAIMLEESNGCVRVWATDGGVHNPGLMQSHNGEHHCNSGTSPMSGTILSPCPAEQINGMIMDGVGGTASGDGLAAVLNRAVAHTNGDGADARAFYIAARMYNSGTAVLTALEQKSAGARCYATNIANRLTGWVHAPKLCWEA